MRITYAERFVGNEQQIALDDVEHGACEGLTDIVTLSGEEIIYEPFWVRTFRFIKLDIQCAAEGLEIFATTCPEEPQNERSECHAWSALPIYEFMRTIAGVHAEQGDWNRIIIQPHLNDLPDLEGCASTPKGLVEFSYQRKDGRWDYKVRIPERVTGCFITPNGEQSELMAGQWNYF